MFFKKWALSNYEGAFVVLKKDICGKSRLRKNMIYGVEKSKIKNYPYCRGVYVDLIKSTRRYLCYLKTNEKPPS